MHKAFLRKQYLVFVFNCSLNGTCVNIGSRRRLQRCLWHAVSLSFIAAVSLYSDAKFLRARRAPPRNLSAINRSSLNTKADNQVEVVQTICTEVFFFLRGVGTMRRHRRGGFQCCRVKKSPSEIFSEYHLLGCSPVFLKGSLLL